MASSNPTQQVKACLKDDAAYKANRKPIIQQIANGNRTYVTALIDTVKTTLKAKKEPAMSKFICLYFLKEAMDIKDPNLAEYLKDKLLKRLCDIAKSNPADVLGSKAESNIVKNFYQLLLEEIYFWSEWFGKDSKGKATKFRSALDDVSRHVKMPEKVMFFKDRSKKDDKKSSESRSSKPQPEPEPVAATADKRRPSLTAPKKEEQKSNLTGRTPEGGSNRAPSTKKIVQDLQVLNEQKNFMVEVLTSDENPDPETLGAVYEQIKESDTRMQNHVQEIFNMPDFAEKENLVNKVMEGTAFTSTYLQEYKRLQNGEIGLAQFKKIILQSTVGSQESPEKPSKKEAAAPKQKKQEQIPVPPKQSKFSTAQQPERKTDFEVNFASVNVPQGQNSAGSGASPFDNFQSTPAVPQGRTSNAFDEFDSGAKIPENNANAFSSFDAAPRPSDRIQNDAFEAQNQFDAYNQSHPNSGQPNDAFNQFNTAPQQATQFEQFDQQPQNNFSDFNTFQEAPKQRRFSNQPEDDFGRFDQYNKNLDPSSNSQNQFQERNFAPEVVQQQEFHEEQAYQAHQPEVVHVQPSFQPRVEIPEMSALRGERKKHEEEEKTYNQNPYDDGGFGEDAFADFDTRNEPRDQESSGFDFDYGGNKKKAGTPHSVASHGNIFDDPHGRRDSFRKEFGQEDHAFDTNFGQGIDENIRNSFNSNQKQQQQQQHYTPNEPETGAFGAFNQQNQNQAWANNAFDSFNKQPEPPAQNNFGGFDGFDDRSQQRNTFESPNAGGLPPRDTMLSASQMVSNNRVQAKYGDMESERLRKERDRILSELEGVKRMYNGMKIEFDYMKQNHDTTSNDYNKVRTELDDLRRTRGQLNFSNEQLRVENDAFKKFRGTLANENDGHLRLFEDMSKELSAIKQKVSDFDVEDQKVRNGSRLMELESSLKNAQYKIESMHNLQRTVHSEFNNVNNEFDRYRVEPAFSPRRELFGSTYSPRRDLHTIGSTSLHPVPTSLDPHNAYQSPPRQRSRSPQIVDLLSLERPHLAASRTSPNRIIRNSPPPLRSSYRAGDLLSTPFDLMNGDLPPINSISQPYRPSVGAVQGLSEYKYSDPLTTSQLNRQTSPPRYTSTGLTNVAEPPRSNFSNLLGFVPKYSDIPPLNPSDIPNNNLSIFNTAGNNTSQTSVLNLPPFQTNTNPNPIPTYSSTLNVQTTLGSYPNKYSQSAGLPSEPVVGFDTLKRQGVSSTMTYSVAIPQQNSASKKAVDLIEKARKMREARSGASSTIGADYQRDSVHNRPSVVNRNLAEDFIMPPPVIGNTNSMQQAGQFGGRLSPTRTRTSPIRANKISPRKSVSSPGRERPSNRPPVYTQEFRGRPSAMGSGPVNIQGEYAVNTRDYASVGAPTNIVTELESQIASLPEGLYRGSPIRERVVNRSEMVELKPTESLRIVERVIGKSPSQRRERSPAPKPTALGEHHRKIFDSKPQTNQRLAETLKSDFELIKRSIDGTGRYGIVSASLNNPLEMAETYQDKNIYRRGTSPSYVPDEMANTSKMLKQYSQDQPIANKFGETLKRGDIRASGTLFRDDLRVRTSGIGLGDTYSGKEVRQTGGAPGVKLTVEDNYFIGSTHTRGFSQDVNHARTAAITEGLINQYNLTGKKIKPKNGRRLEFDHTLFDKFSNAIYGNPYFRDIDTFKNACLVSRANVFETHLLQISSITRNESPVGPNDEILKVIIHYANKSLMDIVDFSAYPLEHSVQYVPQIQGGALTSKYQLKQEFYVSFFDFKNSPYIVNVSYKQESSVKQMDIVLPITVNKFMKFRQGIAKNIFKDTWKQIKFGVTTTGYRNINSKFVRTHAELNKYFENNLIDISPQINAKNKKKYGGAFMLPDNKEYYLKITLDNSRLKVAVACGIGQGGYEEMIAQFLTFLLTV